MADVHKVQEAKDKSKFHRQIKSCQQTSRNIRTKYGNTTVKDWKAEIYNW